LQALSQQQQMRRLEPQQLPAHTDQDRCMPVLPPPLWRLFPSDKPQPLCLRFAQLIGCHFIRPGCLCLGFSRLCFASGVGSGNLAKLDVANKPDSNATQTDVTDHKFFRFHFFSNSTRR
jgi:hypothetical protein